MRNHLWHVMQRYSHESRVAAVQPPAAVAGSDDSSPPRPRHKRKGKAKKEKSKKDKKQKRRHADKVSSLDQGSLSLLRGAWLLHPVIKATSCSSRAVYHCPLSSAWYILSNAAQSHACNRCCFKDQGHLSASEATSTCTNCDQCLIGWPCKHRAVWQAWDHPRGRRRQVSYLFS